MNCTARAVYFLRQQGLLGRVFDDLVIVEDLNGDHVVGIEDPVVVIEAMVGRVELLGMPQVPFANAGRGVSRLLGTPRPESPLRIAGRSRHECPGCGFRVMPLRNGETTREKRSPGGRAIGDRHVEIRRPDPFLRQPIDSRASGTASGRSRTDRRIRDRPRESEPTFGRDSGSSVPAATEVSTQTTRRLTMTPILVGPCCRIPYIVRLLSVLRAISRTSADGHRRTRRDRPQRRRRLGPRQGRRALRRGRVRG